MPLRDSAIFKIIFARGLRIAAATLGIRTSVLFNELRHKEHDTGVTPSDLITGEIWFFFGVSLGGLLSVTLFLTCF